MIDELRALRLIKERFGKNSKEIAVGIGDDTAAISANSDTYLLTTTDSQVEGTHFNLNNISPRTLARKSVAISVSDIAAMGGTPNYILATAGFTKNQDEDYMDSIMDGFQDAEKEFGVKLIGGNLTSAKQLFIDITALGEVGKDKIVRRAGANIGDLIFVSGTLGDSSLGLKILNDKKNILNGDNYLINRHTFPSPRLALGREIANRNLATAMIDISDGLLLDLSRITVDQGSGASLYIVDIPLSEEYKKHISDYSKDTYEYALSGGEDYELLFTASEINKEAVLSLSSEFDIRITEIGIVKDELELNLVGLDGKKFEIEKRGFVHFSQ